MIRFFAAGTPKSMSVGTSFRFKRNGVDTHVQGRRNTDWALIVGEIGRRHAPAAPMQNAVSFTALFYVPRPKTLPKRSARTALPTKRPDVDGLVHKLSDQFNGVFWVDDSQIVDFIVRKRYAAPGAPTGVEIIVEPVFSTVHDKPLQQSLAGLAQSAALPENATSDWRAVLGLSGVVTIEQVEARYRQLARELHPDVGGDPGAMAALNRALEDARKELAA